ncbi:Swi5-domain-containing protein [Dichomitus squalens]|uniref:Swi5-domain-containing protein n=1 Tax=Dichomitus squalens TaxID=114155 RepID=A0A4Q9PHJ4_9APHY|nr:Swi5-domain-containing protein [Dichomitus squalens]
MEYFSFLSSLAGILAVTAIAVTAQTPEPPPNFEAIFAGQSILSVSKNTTGPFGVRVYAPLTGGNLTDAKTGKLVAILLPTADNGIESNSGTFFSSTILPYVWETASVHFHLRYRSLPIANIMHAKVSTKAQQARIAALQAEICELQNILGEDENAEQIVSRHIKLLHRYNEAKDAAQILIGKLAAYRQTTIRQLHQDYGLTDED